MAVLSNFAEADPVTMAFVIAGLLEPSLRLPDPSSTAHDSDANRAERLRGVLEAWADYRTVPDMGRALAATATGSVREAYGRSQTGNHLATMKSFQFIAEDDLSARPVQMFGDRVEKVVYYALITDDSRHVYRFRLNHDGQVVDFDRQER